MVTRLCAFRFPNGEACHSPPLHDGDYCLMHSPDHVKEVQEARRLGGLHRKREATLYTAYDLQPLTTIAGIQRLIELVMTDTVGMESGIARNRLLISLALAALDTLKTSELEQRIITLERSVNSNNKQLALPMFDVEQELLKPDNKEGEHDSKSTAG